MCAAIMFRSFHLLANYTHFLSVLLLAMNTRPNSPLCSFGTRLEAAGGSFCVVGNSTHSAMTIFKLKHGGKRLHAHVVDSIACSPSLKSASTIS